ncbi:DUF4961 domain-containing protein [Flavivirga eckloniae]|uniref:Secretion system C-terminal sorting domain-containing protein n=1 Tax=Flavivirga eckloniae TaxID=1803846 RepID=A0A2K9PU94_9FLAO|nr:DUF4961 domain-containing protein [Flavivirga eckloniae]AUP80640.1 hypothetical protein C1H87_18750 [Flavivirga eckloniae]
MKKLFKPIRKKTVSVILLCFTLLLFVKCITIEGVTQPTTATTGEVINITLDLKMLPEADDDEYLIFGFLAPISWDVENTATVTYTSTVGNGTMSLAPVDEIAPNSSTNLTWANEMASELGIGANSGDVKWIVFKSDVELVGANGVEITGEIQLQVTVGPENLKTQLGYAVANSNYGVKVSNGYHAVSFTNCMEVTGGTNPIHDLCASLSVDNEAFDQASILPNPFNHTLRIDSQDRLQKVEIYSMLGKKVGDIHSGFKNIPTDYISKGVYVVKVYSDKGATTKTLIKN